MSLCKYISMSVLVLTIVPACTQQTPAQAPSFNPNTAIEMVKTLSSDEMEGRGVGTKGGAKAREFILQKLAAADLEQVTTQAFPMRNANGEDMGVTGTNIIARISGQTPGQGPILVGTAHYDHLGVHDGKIYNGADDNASGVGGLFAIAESFMYTPPKHDVILLWVDGEERGLQGARYAVKTMAELQDRPLLNLNLDMISQNKDGEIFAAGTSHTPALKPLIQDIAAPLNIILKFGHDRPEDGAGDWSTQSDHAPFHARGVPFIYLGVEDHDHYHSPSDDFDTIPLETYRATLDLSVRTAHALDKALDIYARTPKPQ